MILSMARGAAICTAAEAGLAIYTYSPKTAKRAMTGSGDATKERIAAMAAMIFGINIKDIPLDSTDALALAMCHAQIALKPELKHILAKPI
jgi:crossover junction endodeoxyribonuclease RuvC